MTHLSKEDRDVYSKVFNEVDLDGDGVLNMTEVVVLCCALGFKLSPADIHKLFVEWDENNDHKITLDEFFKAMSPIPKKEREVAHVRRLFEAADTNKDGVLDANELQVILNLAISECGVQLSTDQCKQLMEKVDLDGDGKMNYEEFLILLAALSQ